jgi:hypothetical protein
MSDGDLPTIKLGKEDFAVPEFAWRDVIKLTPLMSRCAKISFDSITESDMIAYGDLLFLAVSRGKPDLTRETFDALPLSLNQAIAALPVISAQAGLEAKKPGEGQAESDSPGTI